MVYYTQISIYIFFYLFKLLSTGLSTLKPVYLFTIKYYVYIDPNITQE